MLDALWVCSDSSDELTLNKIVKIKTVFQELIKTEFMQNLMSDLYFLEAVCK